MMRSTYKDRPSVLVVCDSKRCTASSSLSAETFSECADLLYAQGWRLHRGRHLCPRCAAKSKDEKEKVQP